MKEEQGQITKLFPDKGIGFVKSEKNQVEYKFRMKSCLFNVGVNDYVVFLIQENTNNATAIRKLYVNKNGIKFTSRVDQSHIHCDLEAFLPRIIDEIENDNENFIELEYEFPFIIGLSECVGTDETDQIIYAKRINRNGHTRFVLNRKPENCKIIFAAFKRSVDKTYIILTVFIGKKAGKEPFDQKSTDDDLQFWKNHALIYKKENIIECSEVSECPW
nr:hypothetical protein [uncultured Flavobacterium sp.]